MKAPLSDWRVAFVGTPLYPSVGTDAGLDATVAGLLRFEGVVRPEDLLGRHMIRRDAGSGTPRRVDLLREDDRAHLRCVWKRHLRKCGVPPALVDLFTVPVGRDRRLRGS